MEDLTRLRIPQTARAVAQAVIDYTDDFCGAHLDAEYAELCRKLVARLARKRPTPLARGDLKIWAAAVVYRIGSLNFLFDRHQKPHLTPDQLGSLMGVSTSTVANKARLIRDLLHLRPLDSDLCRQELLASLPGAWLLVVDGLVVDARSLPPALQQEAYRQGLIPDPAFARRPPPG